MRVIAGKFKGRKLAQFNNTKIRPTTDRVKESVFSILNDTVINVRFLDLCAGTGSIGIEAISRGATHVTFLEQNAKCAKLIEQNLQACGLKAATPQVQLIQKDVNKGIDRLHKQAETYELIYLDPPYSAQLYTKCISQISQTCVLQSNGLMLVQHHKDTELPDRVGGLTKHRQKQYGDTCVTFYQHQSV